MKIIKTFEKFNLFKNKKELEYVSIFDDLVRYRLDNQDNTDFIIDYFKENLISKKIKVIGTKIIKYYHKSKDGKIKNGNIKHGTFEFVLKNIEKLDYRLENNFFKMKDENDTTYIINSFNIVNTLKESKIKRFYTEDDPYGEEDWNNENIKSYNKNKYIV